MRNLCFTDRSLQFSEFTQKSLGSSFSLPPLFFFSLPFFFPTGGGSIRVLLSFLSPSARLQAAGGSRRARGRRREWARLRLGARRGRSGGAGRVRRVRLGRRRRGRGGAERLGWRHRCGRLRRAGTAGARVQARRWRRHWSRARASTCAGIRGQTAATSWVYFPATSCVDEQLRHTRDAGQGTRAAQACADGAEVRQLRADPHGGQRGHARR
jgi:hypothetical protein